MSYIAVDAAISEPRHAHVWRDDDGTIHATVRLSTSTLYFDNVADARAVAAECIKAAEAMDRLSDGGQP